MLFCNLNDGVFLVIIGGNLWVEVWVIDDNGMLFYSMGVGFEGDR